MERRFSNQNVRIESRADGKKGIVGRGIVYYDGTPETEYVLWDDQWGRAVERIMPGAADKALARPDDIRGLFNHDPSQVLGRNKAGTMKLTSDAAGVNYDIEAGDTSVARDVMAHIERGDVSGSSFSFNIPPAGQVWTSTTDQSGRAMDTREITDLELYDLGPVTFPAYDKTTAGVRSAGDMQEARAARDEWRRAGVAALDADQAQAAEVQKISLDTAAAASL